MIGRLGPRAIPLAGTVETPRVYGMPVICPGGVLARRRLATILVHVDESVVPVGQRESCAPGFRPSMVRLVAIDRSRPTEVVAPELMRSRVCRCPVAGGADRRPATFSQWRPELQIPFFVSKLSATLPWASRKRDRQRKFPWIHSSSWA